MNLVLQIPILLILFMKYTIGDYYYCCQYENKVKFIGQIVDITETCVTLHYLNEEDDSKHYNYSIDLFKSCFLKVNLKFIMNGILEELDKL